MIPIFSALFNVLQREEERERERGKRRRIAPDPHPTCDQLHIVCRNLTSLSNTMQFTLAFGGVTTLLTRVALDCVSLKLNFKTLPHV